jgi:GntP family gluconate:H+ symporter
MVALHTAIAIVLAVGLIILLKVDPVIALLLASLYLGLASGVGFTGTIEAIAKGFGEIMAEVGLLIGFGVLIGAFLHSAGAFHRLLDVFVRVIGSTRLPYALSLLHSTILPSIYVDVQVVLASPVARSAAPYIERNGLPMMASALGAGIFAGYVFVIPGLAAISIAGLLGVPLGRWLLFGIVIGPVTAIVTSIIMRLLLRGRLWKPESDEDVDEAMAEQEASWLSPAPRRVLPAPRAVPPAARRVPPAPRRVPPTPRPVPPTWVPPMRPDRCRWGCCCYRFWCPYS